MAFAEDSSKDSRAWLDELRSCTLCEHRCEVDRIAGEVGVCRVTLPVVASAQLHPAPPSSYTVFTAGCNFKCLNCQNWTISCYPDLGAGIRGFVEPGRLAHECVEALASPGARAIRADRIFFSGGAPDVHLPYIEEVVRETRDLAPETLVNFDTNGFLTESSFARVLSFATSVTFDIKAIDNDVHRSLTGAPAAPVLRNAEKIGTEHPEKLWEYRILVIPGITDGQVPGLCDFIAEIDRALPVCFLAFRPNYALEGHPGASAALMEQCTAIARRRGLQNAHWAGFTDLPGRQAAPHAHLAEHYDSDAALLAASCAADAGCLTHPRSCADCSCQCEMRAHVPVRSC